MTGGEKPGFAGHTSRRTLKTLTMKILQEPLLHFAIIGALLFGGYALVDSAEPDTAGVGPIHIGDGEVRWLRETFAKQWRRPPTTDELDGLVAGFVEEDLLAREASALGLDQGDTIVRRRLAQKLTFLVEDTSSMLEPTDEDLRRFYADNISRFQGDQRVAFTHVFFNPERRQNADSDAKAALVRFAASDSPGDAPAAGDPLLIETDLHALDRQSLSNMFGAEFARAVFVLTPGEWSGPIKSGFGVHLVRVTKISPALPRPFEALRDAVIEEWRHQRKSEIKASFIASLRKKYGVVIDGSIKPLLPPEAIAGTAR